MKLVKRMSFLFISIMILNSCNTDDNSIILDDEPLGDYEKGIFITNEGPFGAGTGTVTYISEDYVTIEGSIFNNVNGQDLGNIVQSMGFLEDKAYIIVNNSNKIEVVNRYTFESIASIENGLTNPRYFVGEGNKGFVSNWGDPFDDTDDYISVIDLETNTVISEIPVGFGPEKLVINGNNVYVAHQGGFGQNNIISVIDISQSTLIATIIVGEVPNSMVSTRDDLWVLCGGNPDYTGNETNGSLLKIDTNINGVVQQFDFALTDHPSNLTIDNTNLIYHLNGSIFSKEISSTSLPSNSIIDGFFYAMAANEGVLYATDAGDFASNGTLKVFDLSTNAEIQSIAVGIIPGGIYFNN